MISLEKFAEDSPILVAAHRGASGEAPENTLSSFKLAINEGTDMIETDIQISSDEEFIVYHNSNLYDEENITKKISALSLEELKRIDIGSKFSPNFAGEQIPTLGEVLDLIKHRVYISIEIKNFSENSNQRLLEKLIDLIYAKDMNNFTILSSFHYNVLQKVKDIDKNIHTAAIAIPSLRLKPSELLSQLDFDAYICSISGITKSVSNDCIKHNLKLGLYSIDTEKHLAKALKHNVFALGTNFPARLKSLLADYKKSIE